MKNVLNIILIFIGVTTISAAQVETVENTFNCYAEHLKGQGLLEQTFQTDPFEGDFILCEATVKAASEMQLSAIREKFIKIESVKDSVDCVIESLNNSRFIDLELLKQVFEETQLINDESKLIKLKEVSNILKKLSTESVEICLKSRELRDTFDIMLDKDDEEDLVGDFCARQHVLEKGLIDTNRYKVILNPSNIKTENIKCDEIITAEFKQLEDGIRLHEGSKMLKSEQIECIIGMYHKNDYFSKVMAVGVLGELNLSEEQKQQERETFVKSILNLTVQMSDCI